MGSDNFVVLDDSSGRLQTVVTKITTLEETDANFETYRLNDISRGPILLRIDIVGGFVRGLYHLHDLLNKRIKTKQVYPRRPKVLRETSNQAVKGIEFKLEAQRSEKLS
jgi:hypothetical protein